MEICRAFQLSAQEKGALKMVIYPCKTCGHAVTESKTGQVRHLYVIECDTIGNLDILSVGCNVYGCKCENAEIKET